MHIFNQNLKNSTRSFTKFVAEYFSDSEAKQVISQNIIFLPHLLQPCIILLQNRWKFFL